MRLLLLYAYAYIVCTINLLDIPQNKFKFLHSHEKKVEKISFNKKNYTN